MVWRMGFIIRIALAVAALLFVGPFAAMLAEPFFAELLSDLGIDTSRLGGPVAMLLSQLWFQLLAVGVFGAAVGAWLHWLATKFDKKNRPIQLAEKTHLRLQFGRDIMPYQVLNENVWRWYSMKMIGVLPDGTKQAQVTQVFVTFDLPSVTTFARVTCSNPDRQIVIQDMSDRSAVIVADGDLLDTTVDVIFSHLPV